MVTNLTTIFGNEIKIAVSPHDIARQYHHFAGCDGLSAMHMGSRGRRIVIRGTLRAATNILLQAAIDAVSAYLWAGAADYSLFGITYYFLVFERLEVLTDSRGKTFHLTSDGSVTCSFICYMRGLI